VRAFSAIPRASKVVSPLRFPFSLGRLDSRAGRVEVPRLRAARSSPTNGKREPQELAYFVCQCGRTGIDGNTERIGTDGTDRTGPGPAVRGGSEHGCATTNLAAPCHNAQTLARLWCAIPCSTLSTASYGLSNKQARCIYVSRKASARSPNTLYTDSRHAPCTGTSAGLPGARGARARSWRRTRWASPPCRPRPSPGATPRSRCRGPWPCRNRRPWAARHRRSGPRGVP
jgi:hypothetical protein